MAKTGNRRSTVGRIMQKARRKLPLSLCLFSDRMDRVKVILRSQSTVEYRSVASVSTVDSGLTNLIHGRYSCTLFTLGWMCPLKREQARRERESELRLVNSL